MLHVVFQFSYFALSKKWFVILYLNFSSLILNAWIDSLISRCNCFVLLICSRFNLPQIIRTTKFHLNHLYNLDFLKLSNHIKCLLLPLFQDVVAHVVYYTAFRCCFETKKFRNHRMASYTSLNIRSVLYYNIKPIKRRINA